MPSICSKQLSPGDVVFECKPLIHVLTKEFKGEYCDNCLQRSDSLKRCAKCLQMFYCDRNCQTFDWIQHKNECKLFRGKGIDLKEEKDLYILCIRFVLCIKNDKTFATKRHQLIDGSDVCLNDIETNYEELVENTNESIFFQYFEQLFQSYGFNRKELLHWFAVIKQNLSRIPVFEGEKPIEDILCLCLCIQTCPLSHSCLPNTAIVNNGLTLQVRAMKAIGSGEELTISCDHVEQYESERHRFPNYYSIDCKCGQNLNLEVVKRLQASKEALRRSSTAPELYGKESVSEFMSLMTARLGQYSPAKTRQLYELTRFNLKVPPSLRNPMHQMFTEEFLKELKEAIPITHGVSHPLAISLAKIIGEQ